MFSLFSLNPLNALGSAISMASARGWTECPAAIALVMGWSESRGFCAFRQSVLGNITLDNIALGNIALGTITNGLNIRTSIEYQGTEYISNEQLGNEQLGNEQLGNQHLGNRVFKSNPSVDSDPRPSTSGRYRFTPIPT